MSFQPLDPSKKAVTFPPSEEEKKASSNHKFTQFFRSMSVNNLFGKNGETHPHVFSEQDERTSSLLDRNINTTSLQYIKNANDNLNVNIEPSQNDSEIPDPPQKKFWQLKQSQSLPIIRKKPSKKINQPALKSFETPFDAALAYERKISLENSGINCIFLNKKIPSLRFTSAIPTFVPSDGGDMIFTPFYQTKRTLYPDNPDSKNPLNTFRLKIHSSSEKSIILKGYEELKENSSIQSYEGLISLILKNFNIELEKVQQILTSLLPHLPFELFKNDLSPLLADFEKKIWGTLVSETESEIFSTFSNDLKEKVLNEYACILLKKLPSTIKAKLLSQFSEEEKDSFYHSASKHVLENLQKTDKSELTEQQINLLEKLETELLLKLSEKNPFYQLSDLPEQLLLNLDKENLIAKQKPLFKEMEATPFEKLSEELQLQIEEEAKKDQGEVLTFEITDQNADEQEAFKNRSAKDFYQEIQKSLMAYSETNLLQVSLDQFKTDLSQKIEIGCLNETGFFFLGAIRKQLLAKLVNNFISLQKNAFLEELSLELQNELKAMFYQSFNWEDEDLLQLFYLNSYYLKQASFSTNEEPQAIKSEGLKSSKKKQRLKISFKKSKSHQEKELSKPPLNEIEEEELKRLQNIQDESYYLKAAANSKALKNLLDCTGQFEDYAFVEKLMTYLSFTPFESLIKFSTIVNESGLNFDYFQTSPFRKKYNYSYGDVLTNNSKMEIKAVNSGAAHLKIQRNYMFVPNFANDKKFREESGENELEARLSCIPVSFTVHYKIPRKKNIESNEVGTFLDVSLDKILLTERAFYQAFTTTFNTAQQACEKQNLPFYEKAAKALLLEKFKDWKQNAKIEEINLKRLHLLLSNPPSWLAPIKEEQEPELSEASKQIISNVFSKCFYETLKKTYAQDIAMMKQQLTPKGVKF